MLIIFYLFQQMTGSINANPIQQDRPSIRFDKGDDNTVNAYIAWNAPNCNGCPWPVTGYTVEIKDKGDSLILVRIVLR